MKKFLISIFIFMFVFTNVISAEPLKKISIFISEENRGDLYINGNYVDNDPVLFTIIKENETGIIKEDGGETLFPLRTIFENLGAEVNSDETGKNIEILYNGNKYLCSVFYNKMAIVSNDENLYNSKYYVIRIFDTKNNNLLEQAQAIYQQMFIDNARSDWTEGTLSDIADITMGQSPSSRSYNEDGNGTIFFQGRAEFGFRFPSIRLYTTEPKRMAQSNDTLMSVRAPVGDLNVAHTDCCIGRGLAAIHSKYNHQSFVLYTMFSLKKQLDVFNGEGTVFGSINRNSLNGMPILIPSDDILEEFERIVAPMDLTIRNNYDEICRLQDIRDTLLPRLISGEIDVSDIGF